ncbi:hypothetical protein GCM10025868_01700 [Angustibacter aerolatus]|uniref:Uncharacterized protein n=1 Tax=Angustibacter aerolatus TaxID=1162965 RepID=A0ABQ6JCJ1_9ACTN|nr:hypothetical protein GCM10025868_01700 [Angustibacter aerolatus]
MLFDTFAVTGGTPRASSTGNVTSVPDPTSEFIAPAVAPASATASSSYQGTG